MTYLLKRIDTYIDELVDSYSATERGLSLFRILFALQLIFFSAGPRALWVAEYPDVFWAPPQPLSFFDCVGTLQFGVVCGFPSFWVFAVFEVGLALAAVFLLFGYRTFYASILFSVFYIVLNSFRYSFGKIDHDILFVIAPAILAFSGWGNHFSLDAKQNRKTGWSYPSYSLLFLALAIAVGFLSAGFPKAVNWIDFDLSTSGVRNWVVNNYFANERTDWLAPVFASLSNVWVWEAMDYAGVLFEVGLALSVIHGKYFKTFLGIAVLFHFQNYLILNIPFTGLLPVYASFMPWEYVSDKIPKYYLSKITSLLTSKNLYIFTPMYITFYMTNPLSSVPYFSAFKVFLYFGSSMLVIAWLISKVLTKERWFLFSPNTL